MSNKQIIELEWFTREDPKPQYGRIICIHYVDSVDGKDYGFFFGKRILKTSKDLWNKKLKPMLFLMLMKILHILMIGRI